MEQHRLKTELSLTAQQASIKEQKLIQAAKNELEALQHEADLKQQKAAAAVNMEVFGRTRLIAVVVFRVLSHATPFLDRLASRPVFQFPSLFRRHGCAALSLHYRSIAPFWLVFSLPSLFPAALLVRTCSF